MRNIKKKLSALVLTTVFASMQLQCYAAIDTGLGVGNGGAVINSATGGNMNFVKGTNTANLNFSGDSHVKWNTLNVNKGETLNFNAVNGANGIKVLNTVNSGMSNIYGTINADSGIGQLIISNPNGVMFDGAKFTAAGDVMITSQPMAATFNNGNLDIRKTNVDGNLGFVTIENSDFSVGGQFNIMAPSISTIASTVNAGNGFKLITANGQDYLSTTNTNVKDAVRLEAVNIDGNVYIIADKGVVKTVTGGEIKGDLNIISDDNVALNYVANGKALHVTGDVNATGNGTLMYARNTKVDGNLTMENGGGFLEVGNVVVGKDMNLTTVAKSENAAGYKHFVHVIGKDKVGGNVNIKSKDNVHIGNYNYEQKVMLDGKLEVGGDLNVHAQDGHVAVTIDTTANKIDLKSDNLNVLTDGKALMTANEYKFSSAGYIGGLEGTEKFIDSMENYTYYPGSPNATPSYANIAGGKVAMIHTGTDGEAYIASNGDMDLTGANANKIYLTSYGNDIQILGDDVHANEINVGYETDTLRVEFPERDYTLKYTNIRDAKEVTIKGDEEITYELTNGENGYNTRDPRPDNTTYLVGPDKPVVPPVEPEDPIDPPVEPPVEPDEPITPPVEPEDPIDPPVEPPVEPDEPITPPVEPQKPVIDPQDHDNVKILNNLGKDTVAGAIDANLIYTPIAYAADLEDDRIDAPIRKNVDGSVTVVRAFPMGK